MKDQHTPGPWDVRQFSGDHGRATVEQKRDDLTERHTPVASICEMYGSPGLGCSVANARLIASAPDMLALLREWASPDITQRAHAKAWVKTLALLVKLDGEVV